MSGGANTHPARLDRDWYRIRYNLVALRANWASDLKEDDDVEPGLVAKLVREAHPQARDLCIDVLETLGNSEASPELRRFLEQELLPATLVILAGTSEAASGTPPTTPGKQPRLDRAAILELVREDAVSTEAVVEFIEAAEVQQPRVLYNLACLLTRDNDLPKAARELVRALDLSWQPARGRLAAWALEDPSLETLLNDWPGLRKQLELEAEQAKPTPAPASPTHPEDDDE